MEENVITNGNVPFADIKVGSIVKVVDYYDRVAVGIVEEKKETTECKSVGVRFGFDSDKIKNVIIEETTPNGEPMYMLSGIVRSFV